MNLIEILILYHIHFFMLLFVPIINESIDSSHLTPIITSIPASSSILTPFPETTGLGVSDLSLPAHYVRV